MSADEDVPWWKKVAHVVKQADATLWSLVEDSGASAPAAEGGNLSALLSSLDTAIDEATAEDEDHVAAVGLRPSTGEGRVEDAKGSHRDGDEEEEDKEEAWEGWPAESGAGAHTQPEAPRANPLDRLASAQPEHSLPSLKSLAAVSSELPDLVLGDRKNLLNAGVSALGAVGATAMRVVSRDASCRRPLPSTQPPPGSATPEANPGTRDEHDDEDGSGLEYYMQAIGATRHLHALARLRDECRAKAGLKMESLSAAQRAAVEESLQPMRDALACPAAAGGALAEALPDLAFSGPDVDSLVAKALDKLVVPTCNRLGNLAVGNVDEEVTAAGKAAADCVRQALRLLERLCCRCLDAAESEEGASGSPCASPSESGRARRRRGSSPSPRRGRSRRAGERSATPRRRRGVRVHGGGLSLCHGHGARPLERTLGVRLVKGREK